MRGDPDNPLMSRFQFIVGTVTLPNFQDVEDLEEAGPDEPIKLALAPYLPEIGLSWSEKVLRGAINRGDLPAEKIGRAIFVTRRGIREWRERCQLRRAHASGSSRPAPTTKDTNAQPSGSSETDRAKLAQVAARMTFQALRNSLKSTSRSATPTPNRSSRRALTTP
ncbi:hypothetical protein [Jiella sp. M17.18]|uniref:hypothetical protein n=1 Tax=Jiella sp. M17.18 TaxID=3234247 RepID=UPI0034E04565